MRRRTLIHNLRRILDANDLDDLFTGPPSGDAERLGLLRRLAGAPDPNVALPLAQLAQRRRVTPAYISDRATVLLSSITERRRRDLYSVLGVTPLAGPDEIRRRWREVARRLHPDAGGEGDAAQFEQVKAAHAILSDPQRRGEYEARWKATIGRTEEAAALLEDSGRRGVPEEGNGWRWLRWRRRALAASVLDAALLPRLGTLDARLAAEPGQPGLANALSLSRQLQTAVARVDAADLDAAIEEVRQLIEGLSEVRASILLLRGLRARMEDAEPQRDVFFLDKGAAARV